LTCYLNAREGEPIKTRDFIGRVKYYLNTSVSAKQTIPIRAMAYEIRRGRRLNPQETHLSRKPETNKGSYCLWGNWAAITENQLLQSFNILYTLAETQLNSTFYMA
jgi:hypothetical protein